MKKEFDYIKKISHAIQQYSNYPEEVADWIGCQFALESNFGNSDLAKENNNHCGMRNPMVRISASLHSGDSLYHWAVYASLIQCIFDYILCIQYHKPLSVDYDTISHYSNFIKKFYCPEKDYTNKINLIYQQFKTLQNE